MPLQEWEPTRLHLQLLCQILGKIRLRYHPKINHWWHATLYLSPRGLTTDEIPYGEKSFDIELDLLSHAIHIRTSSGERASISLQSKPICDVYKETMSALSDLGINVHILAKPYDCKSNIPFAEDDQHNAYDPDRAVNAWGILLHADAIFKEFRGRFVGKCSPVHMFWHSFDLAVTRFSGRKAPPLPEANAVTQEAYSQEVNSAGFWFGDDRLPEPAFYCYTAPAPQDLNKQPLAPNSASWQEVWGSPMAILRYEDFRKADDPRTALLNFLQSSYEAGANAASWDRINLEI